MRSYTIEDRTVHVPKDVVCNKCGESCVRPDLGDALDAYACNVTYSTGYLSKDLPDGETYEFDLCEKCLAELMRSFKVPAETSGWIG